VVALRSFEELWGCREDPAGVRTAGDDWRFGSGRAVAGDRSGPYHAPMSALHAGMNLFERGGPVMWPLLAMSLLSVALTVERAWFWWQTNGPGASRWIEQATAALLARDAARLRQLSTTRRPVYGAVLVGLGRPTLTDATGVELAEAARPQIDRFSAIQSVIVTAAPLIGILGTVLGIIDSFNVLSATDATRDVNAVAAGIAEALITTAAGLTVALVTLFPHAIFRAQSSACYSAIERMTAAALQAAASPQAGPVSGPATTPAQA
jgi:biopolymer transport protein ExbB